MDSPSSAASQPALPAPSLVADLLKSLEERIHKLEMLKVAVCAAFVAFTVVTGACGLNLFNYVDEQMKQHIPKLIHERANKAAQQAFDQELPKQVVPRIKREVEQQFEDQRPELKRLIESQVASVIPAAMKLGWMAEQLGGNITTGPGHSIERIDLSGTRVTDTDLARLAEQEGIGHVKSLVLRNTSVTAKGLAGLAKWPRLEEVDLTGTAAKKAEARAALPASIRIKTD